jgi:hypothetical protein
MAIARDLLMTVVLCILAGWLPNHFLEYRGVAIGEPYNNQARPAGLIIATDTRTLNVTDTILENGQMTAHPKSMLIQNGFYAHSGYSVPEAITGGIAAPLLALIGAAHFVARARRKSRQLAMQARGK